MPLALDPEPRSKVNRDTSKERGAASTLKPDSKRKKPGDLAGKTQEQFLARAREMNGRALIVAMRGKNGDDRLGREPTKGSIVFLNLAGGTSGMN